MKTVIGKTVGIAIALVGLLLGSPAYADSISYTVGGWSGQFPGSVTPPAGATWGPTGYPGDTVALEGYTGTLDLTPGTYVQKINTLLWTINYTYAGTETDPDAWSDLSFDLTLARSIQFGGLGGPSAQLTQPGLLNVTWDNDFLSVSPGSMVSLLIPGYQIDITPLGLEVGGSNFEGSNPWVQPNQDIMARFVVTSVPVPDAGSTLTLLGLALIGLCGMTRRFQVI